MIHCLNNCGTMQQTQYEGVIIDVCPTCKGVWLDPGELTTIVETREHTWSAETIERVLELTGGVGIPNKELNRSLRCPKCNEDLAPVNYQGTSGVIVNTCQANHGVWLDAGELAKVQIYLENWQKKTRR